MHELSLTAELLKLLERDAQQKDIERIRKVKLVIGGHDLSFTVCPGVFFLRA